MPASRSAARTASLPSTTSPKWRSSSGGCERPAASAMNWSPMSMNAIRGPARPRSSNSKKRPYQASASSTSSTSSAMWLMPTRRAMRRAAPRLLRDRGGCAGVHLQPLGLVEALGCLVVEQRLLGVHVSKRRVARYEILGRFDVEALGQHGAERLDLHVSEPGERGQVGAQCGGVGGVAPDAAGVAVV